MTSKDVLNKKHLKDELKKNLSKIKTSDRFLMLRLLRLSHFMPSGTFGTSHLDQLTLEDLVEQGGDIFFEKDEVEGSTVKELIKILNNFLKDDSATSSLELLDDIPPTLDEEGTNLQDSAPVEEINSSFSKLELKQKSSIEEENILLKAYEDLQQTRCFDQIKNIKLSKYWDTTKVRDLFLEDITFKQLLSIKVEYILEKHSFTKTKLEAIVDEIYKCIKENSDEIELKEIKETKEDACSRIIKDKEVENLFSDDVIWLGDDISDADISDAILSQLKIALYNSKGNDRWLTKIIKSFPTILSAKEYVIWWCEAVYGLKLTSKLLNIPSNDLSKEYKACIKKINSSLPEVAPVFCSHWQGALAGAGVSFSILTSPYKIDSISECFQKVFFKGLLHTFNAVNVTAYGVIIPDDWTTNPILLEIILDGLKKEKKLVKNDRERVLKKVLPLIPYKDLNPIFSLL